MTDPPEPPPEIDTNSADALLIQIAGMLLEGAKTTHDPRLRSLSDSVIATLKKGDILETLLIAFAQQTKQSEEPEFQLPPMTDALLRRMAQLQAKR